MIIRRPTEAVRHLMEDVYNLNKPFAGCVSCLVYESSHGTICSFVSTETPASMFLLFCSIVYWLLVGLASPWCSSRGRDVKMHWLGLALGEAAGIYSLLPVRFNKSWWLAEVYYLDMFLKPYDCDGFPCTWCIFDSFILLYFIHCYLVPNMDRSLPGILLARCLRRT